MIIGIAAGGAAYLIETHRVEQAALERAELAAEHFASPAMRLLSPQDAPEGHGHLRRLLDRSRFIGIRVFTPDKMLAYEVWEDISPELVASAKMNTHDWPELSRPHSNWIEIENERLIQVVLALKGDNNSPIGYLEGVYRLDRESLLQQRHQILDGALMAVASVLTTAALLYPLLLAMLRRSSALSRRLLESNLSLMRSLGNAVAKRDSDTDMHNYRVTLYAVALAESLGIPSNEIPDLVAGAFLHDVGKIGIPDRILLKPGKLTPEEFEVMKTHTRQGLDIVAGNAWMKGAASVIGHHHERFDGTGYPERLRGHAIPRNARIFAVVDVFDALTSVRPYKEAMTLPDALALIDKEAGQHFDPEIVSKFKEISTEAYSQTATASADQLHRKMQVVLCRYFNIEAAPEGAAEGDDRDPGGPKTAVTS